MVMLSTNDSGYRGLGGGGTLAEFFAHYFGANQGSGNPPVRGAGSTYGTGPTYQSGRGRTTGYGQGEGTFELTPGSQWTPPWAPENQGNRQPGSYVPLSATSAQGEPASRQAGMSAFSRDPSLPRSADAASVWARGGSEAVQRAQREYSDQFLQDWVTQQGTTQYVGIEDLGSWANGLGISPVPLLGTNVTGPNDTMIYQLPEYQTWQINSTLQSMSAPELARFREKAKAAGLYRDDAYLPQSEDVYPADVEVMSMLMTEANITSFDSWEAVLEQRIQNPSGELGDGTESGTGYEGPTTQRDIVYNETSIDAGRSILRNLMRSMIGREPSDSEVSQYVSYLNRKERNNPQIVETVSEMGENEGTVINTKRVLQNAPDAQETLLGRVEDKNAGERFTYQAQDFFTRMMEIL